MRKTKRYENKSGLAVLAAGLALALAWPSPALGAEAQGHKLAFKAGAGAIIHTSQDFEPGFLYSVGFSTRLSGRLGLDILIGGNTVKMNEPPAGLTAGSLETTQLLISGHYRLIKDGRFIPYGIFGVEFNFYHFLPAAEADENKYNVVDRFAPHFGAGLEWALSNSLSLSADARYSIVKTWVEDLPREGTIGEVNPDEVGQIGLHALTVALSLKFYFR